MNSINWGRVLAQVVYYFTAAAALGAPHRRIAFTVPTGNFGDVFAGYVALRMGLPVDRLVIATNANDILARALATGTYEVRDVIATASPSMDIQVSSNFERLLFDACGRNAGVVRALMGSLAQSRRFTIPPAALAEIRAHFSAERAGEEETAATIRMLRKESGYLCDPHTAVASRWPRRKATIRPFPWSCCRPRTRRNSRMRSRRRAAYARRCRIGLPICRNGASGPPRLPADQGAVERFILAASRAAQAGAAA